MTKRFWNNPWLQHWKSGIRFLFFQEPAQSNKLLFNSTSYWKTKRTFFGKRFPL